MSNELDILTADSGTVAMLSKSEIDMQIATAHKYPRSIKRFRDEALAMVTLSESVAQECIYSLPRDGKTIEGPSARFAEVVACAWGNSRAGARVVSDAGDFVTAQGVFHDLERNVAITYEVQRRIVDRQGRRFKPDMIGVTANAACSIALRNAILKGVPKAFWSDMYEQARLTAIGTVQTLANRRARALAVLQKMGVTPDKVFAFLKVKGQEDITLEHLATLFGITTALKEGETTPERAFAVADDSADVAKPAAIHVPTPSRRKLEAPQDRGQVDQQTGEIQPTKMAPSLNELLSDIDSAPDREAAERILSISGNALTAAEHEEVRKAFEMAWNDAPQAAPQPAQQQQPAAPRRQRAAGASME